MRFVDRHELELRRFVIPDERLQPRPTPDSDAYICEVVGSQWVRKPSGPLARWIAGHIYGGIYAHADALKLGTTIQLCYFPTIPPNDPNRLRRPDVAFVSAERWPTKVDLPDSDPWPVVPNIVADVLAPDTDRVDITRKVAEFFDIGTQLVWVVDPKSKLVSVYASPKVERILAITDSLDGGEVLPGFSLPLAELFGPQR